MEGALPSYPAKQVQVEHQQKGKDKGNKKMHKDDPSEGQERDFVLVDHEVAPEENVMDLDAQIPRSVKDLIIKEK